MPVSAYYDSRHEFLPKKSFGCLKAVDEVVDGYPNNSSKEWRLLEMIPRITHYSLTTKLNLI